MINYNYLYNIIIPVRKTKVSTRKPRVSARKPRVSTRKPRVSTRKPRVSAKRAPVDPLTRRRSMAVVAVPKVEITGLNKVGQVIEKVEMDKVRLCVLTIMVNYCLVTKNIYACN